jgi:hypothetical protein
VPWGHCALLFCWRIAFFIENENQTIDQDPEVYSVLLHDSEMKRHRYASHLGR